MNNPVNCTEEHTLALIELYIELQRKQDELGENVAKALGLNEQEVSPQLLDASISKVESLILDCAISDEKLKSYIYGEGMMYGFYLDCKQNAKEMLKKIQKV